VLSGEDPRGEGEGIAAPPRSEVGWNAILLRWTAWVGQRALAGAVAEMERCAWTAGAGEAARRLSSAAPPGSLPTVSTAAAAVVASVLVSNLY
jgi:hypothetical protein